jgi:glycerol-3-phosphate acyltransferase PlsX
LEVEPALAEVKAHLDYETYGGAQLLGVKSVAVIAHGSSSRLAIANALVMARDAADHDLPARLAEQLA